MNKEGVKYSVQPASVLGIFLPQDASFTTRPTPRTTRSFLLTCSDKLLTVRRGTGNGGEGTTGRLQDGFVEGNGSGDKRGAWGKTILDDAGHGRCYAAISGILLQSPVLGNSPQSLMQLSQKLAFVT